MFDWLFGKKEDIKDTKDIKKEEHLPVCDHDELNPSNTNTLLETPIQFSELHLRGNPTRESLCECTTCGGLFSCSSTRSSFDYNYYYHYRGITDFESKEYIRQCIRGGIELNAVLIGRLMKKTTRDSKVTGIVKSGNKISCLNGYAITFDNGNGLCVVNNVIVPDKWIFHKDELNADDFIQAQNMEERNRLTQIIGEEKLKLLLGNSAKELNSFSLENSKVTLIYRHCGGIDMKMLKMQNNWDSSPYYLFVPPWIRTAKEGVAWSFYQDPSDYKPVVEA